MDPTNFHTIYPSYLDSTKSIKQGRRIGIEQAVDTPTVSDISQALQQLQLKHVLQPHKGYSRDTTTLWDNPGRIRVDLSSSDQHSSKRQWLVEIAKRIPALPSRVQRLEQHEAQRKAEEAKQAQAKAAAALKQKQIQQTQKQSTKRSNKKKGKKKR